jgi:hypothetical protein
MRFNFRDDSESTPPATSPSRTSRRRRGAAPSIAAAALMAAVSIAWSPPARAQWQWTDVTTPALAETTSIRDKKGQAFVDFDRDGDLDIFTIGEGAHVGTMLVNDGAGNFTPFRPAAVAPHGSASAQTWGDYDRDGDLDVFLSMEEESQKLLRNDGNGVFTNVTPAVLLPPRHGHSATWIDVDRDGWLDLYVAFFKQPSMLLHNDHGTLIDATVDSLAAFPGDGMAWGDYDNDGDPDVYLARFDNTANLLLRNDGPDGFTDITTPNIEGTDSSHSAACADYDNDGDLDIYVANSYARNHLFRNDGTAQFVDYTPVELSLGWHSGSENWGDFDDDGWLDLYVSCTDDSTNHLFRNNHNGTFTDVTSGPLRGTGHGAGIANGDYDGDGDLDLYVSSYLNYPNLLLRNDLANGNHWLEIDLVGTVSNLTALGARVELTAGGMTQTRVISGNVGFRSQDASTVHFGLGSVTQIDRLRITWPSRITLDTTIVGVDRRLTIVESGEVPLAAPVAKGSPSALTLAGPAPNPVTREATFELALPSTTPGRIAIVDAQGRMVRRLASGSLPSGRRSIRWDGKDELGRRVASGIYWCVLEAAGNRVSRRLAVLP